MTENSNQQGTSENEAADIAEQKSKKRAGEAAFQQHCPGEKNAVH